MWSTRYAPHRLSSLMRRRPQQQLLPRRRCHPRQLPRRFQRLRRVSLHPYRLNHPTCTHRQPRTQRCRRRRWLCRPPWQHHQTPPPCLPRGSPSPIPAALTGCRQHRRHQSTRRLFSTRGPQCHGRCRYSRSTQPQRQWPLRGFRSRRRCPLPRHTHSTTLPPRLLRRRRSRSSRRRRTPPPFGRRRPPPFRRGTPPLSHPSERLARVRRSTRDGCASVPASTRPSRICARTRSTCSTPQTPAPAASDTASSRRRSSRHARIV